MKQGGHIMSKEEQHKRTDPLPPPSLSAMLCLPPKWTNFSTRIDDQTTINQSTVEVHNTEHSSHEAPLPPDTRAPTLTSVIATQAGEHEAEDFLAAANAVMPPGGKVPEVFTRRFVARFCVLRFDVTWYDLV